MMILDQRTNLLVPHIIQLITRFRIDFQIDVTCLHIRRTIYNERTNFPKQLFRYLLQLKCRNSNHAKIPWTKEEYRDKLDLQVAPNIPKFGQEIFFAMFDCCDHYFRLPHETHLTNTIDNSNETKLNNMWIAN